MFTFRNPELQALYERLQPLLKDGSRQLPRMDVPKTEANYKIAKSVQVEILKRESVEDNLGDEVAKHELSVGASAVVAMLVSYREIRGVWQTAA